MQSSAIRLRLAVLGAIALTTSAGYGDLIRLKTGGELRGRVLKADRDEAAAEVTVETLTGAKVTLPADAVEFVSPQPRIVDEYDGRAKRTPETVPDQLALADWCRNHGLNAQRMIHLQRVIELEPEHEKAHLALGHTWHEGQWVDRDELMASRGYVKYKGKYITTLELELIEKSEQEVAAEKAWYPKIKLWLNWLKGNHYERQQEGLANLHGVTDPDASPAVTKFLAEDASPNVRQLAVQVLSQPGGPKPVAGLAKLIVFDPVPELRQAALHALKVDQYETAQRYLLRNLKHEQNPVVCRAAAALAVVGDEQSIFPLIDALVTSHRYTIRVPVGQVGVSLGSNGGIGGAGGSSLPPDIEAGLRTGQYPNGVIVLNGPGPSPEATTRPVTVTYSHQNSEALAALQKLTGRNFGFEERTWKLFWTAEKSGVSKLPAVPQ